MMKQVLKSFNELTLKELHSIYYTRIQVFVVEQRCPYQDVDETDLTCDHLMLKDDEDKLLAYARLIGEPNGFRIGRIVVSPNFRRHGYGRLIFQEALNAGKWKYPDAKVVNIQAQAYLKAFYESFGFMIHSDSYLEDDIPHYDMKLMLQSTVS
ncbi:ELLA family acetyltransferase [Schizosaccharomyces octosporus yFS286]|uniref:ELLA family acetyltransferase n=1 Tax=Schizosaccharomyces octosporus (strain yFS286) TaxID=483514 RepID=S9PRU6_SCHOY|nr:ELLA family acetyltransferase [Schizosaccharomyces octosporus yFS286]EPX71906.1 ELLA family acetyltransferase [Schizosaccharomyces octosporus yFS286]